MIKNYTNQEYADKAVEANSSSQKLYILVTPTEFERNVLDFTTEIIQQPVYNENGEQIGTESVEVQIPVMIDKEVPAYDEEGNQTGTEIIQVQSSHKEKYIEDVATLIVAEVGYYVCYQENYTDGTINENLENERIQVKQTQFNQEFFLTSLGYIRRKVSMSTGETKDFLSDLLPVISMGIQSGQTVPIITYSLPDFTQELTTEYLESLQSVKNVTAQFVQECFLQLSNDFMPVSQLIEE